MIRLHDTATGEVRELTLREPGRVSMYVCGPTVYDVPHIGHGRSALTYDILRRYLEWRGLEVRHVSNVTDIDDNIINRAAEEGRTPEEVAVEFERAWYDAVDALGVLRPTDDPHATAFVDRMLDLVGELLAADLAYETSDGVYLDVEQVPGYGLLAQQPLEDLRSGARVEANEEKRSPLDFVLWKKAKPGEPSWPSPWGPGRPGWHTKCVVMSLDLLGDGFDLHSGGLDLKFPHHENERAQAVALGHTFARHWMHHAFVEVGGVKMSKSLKNFTSLVDLLSKHDARAYRLLVLRSHYRSPMEVTVDTIEDAEAALERLDSFARRVPSVDAEADPAALDRFRELMDDDLRTPQATALLFELVGRANAGDVAAAAAAHEIAGAFGLPLRGEASEVDAATAALVAERDQARAARDFARADALRDRLQAEGWVVEDTPEGTKIHR
ncbi:MAG TPA: cysteine--tRNA ligase [Acidimicrobiales bacterium]|nr:cysteine--tRNA ligase [Acidimicrobiales bacterium]